ncbi:MAG TPA: SdpI family protein [Anaerolineae bacterium]
MLYYSLFLGAILLAVGIATYYLAPRVGPNPIFGVRIGYAYASREIWDKTNRFGGALMALVGVGTALFGLLLTLLNVEQGDGRFWLIAAMLAALFGGLAWIFFYARNLAQGTAMAREMLPVPFRWAYLTPVILTFVILAAVTLYFAPQLPADHVASHFNINDQPDGWTSRLDFVISFLGLGLLFVIMDAIAVIVAAREPLIALGRWGASWRLDPARGLVYLGPVFGLVNLLLSAVLLNVVWYNTRGGFLYPFSILLLGVAVLVVVLIVMFFALARREKGGNHA